MHIQIKNADALAIVRKMPSAGPCVAAILRKRYGLKKPAKKSAVVAIADSDIAAELKCEAKSKAVPVRVMLETAILEEKEAR